MLGHISQTSPAFWRHPLFGALGVVAGALLMVGDSLAAETQGNTSSLSTVTMDVLCRAVGDRESALQSVAFTVKYHIRRRKTPSPGKYETLDATDSCVFDNGRVRCENVTGIPGNELTLRRSLAVFNGKESRLLEGESPKSGGTRWVHGRIGDDTSTFSWEMPPCDLFLHEHGRPFGVLLRDQNARIRGMSMWEGRSVVEVERGPFVRDQGTYKGLYLLDPARGFAVVRQASFVQYPPDTKWNEYATTETFDYREIHPGIWVPTRASRQFSNIPGESVAKGLPPELWWRGEARFSDWQLHPKMSEDSFTLHFPEGLSVHDDRHSDTK